MNLARRSVVLVATMALSAGILSSAPDVGQAAGQLPIAAIQGTGARTPYANQPVTTTASVVTAVYGQASSDFRGFVIQTPGTGGATKSLRTASNAVFVYMGSTPFDVSVGDAVRVSGTAGEFPADAADDEPTLTQIGGPVTVTPLTTRLAALRPVTGKLWASTVAGRENLESMLYRSNEPFVISDTFTLRRFGELSLSAGRQAVQPTDVGRPGSAAASRQAALNEATRVQLDDGTNRGYTQTATLPARQLPYLTPNHRISVGDTLTLDEPVIIDYRNGSWKLNPTRAIEAGDEPASIKAAPADKTPRVRGAFSVASFNVLNYFTSLADGRAGCSGTNLSTDGTYNLAAGDACAVRGAYDAADLTRQQDKITTAINKLDASVVGLMEIENSVKLGETADEATTTLVDALNTAAGERKWDYVRSRTSDLQPVADQDVITNAFIYQPAEVRLNSTWALGSAAGADGAFANARTPIAASFTSRSGGSPMVVIVNHFKSKSASGATGDNVDTGQGAYNADRVEQAEAVKAWIPTLQGKARTDAVAVIGDFNSYTAEDPLQVFYRAGYTNAAPANEYSYVFDGLSGSLDHILVNRDARRRMTEGDVWDINAGQSDAYEYSAYRTTAVNYYSSNELRASDHNPVVAGFAKGPKSKETTVTLLNFNDFHGRIAAGGPNTVAFFGTIEQQRAQAGEDNTLLLSAGDNIGGSLFASLVQQDQPTIDVMNAADLTASAVGNHEFDKGFDDLAGRVTNEADWTYLGANVYQKGTTTPALPEYALVKKAGLTIGVIGAVTSDTPTLVSAAGVAGLTFGDPVEAVNRVAKQLSDGKKSNGEADVLIAEYHEGANEGKATSTVEEQVDQSPIFAKIVQNTSATVDAIFTGHTHVEYAWDAPVPGQADKTRPILESASYAALLGKVSLTVNTKTKQVVAYERENLPITTVPNPELIAQYPRVAEIAGIVDDALTTAQEIGGQVIGSTTGPITRAKTAAGAEDRGAESTIGNLVANMLRDQMSDPARGGAQIGVQNPGGNRADLDTGDVTYGEAASVLPFANSLFTLNLTGAQFKTLLEQQWQVAEDGTPIGGSRPFLQLGLSDNVSYTFDASRPQNQRITSISVDGVPIDPAKTYRIATPSFLTTGGDNFHVFKQATDKRDSGLVDLDVWVDYVRTHSPLSPSFVKRAVSVTPLPTTLASGQTTTFTVSTLDFTSPNPPPTTTTQLVATLNGVEIGTFAVGSGSATVALAVPADARTGPGELVLTANTGTTIRIPVTVG